MSHLLSVGEICDRALRKIGAFPTRSSGARGADVEESRYWLDFVVAHQAARQRTWWLVPATVTFPLTAGTDTYDMAQQIGGTQAPNGISSVASVVLYNTKTGLDLHSVAILRRLEFEQRNVGGRNLPSDDPWQWAPASSRGNAEAPGAPVACYITRDQSPIIRFAPVPDSVGAYGVRVVCQGYSKDFVAADATERVLNLRSTWFLWLVTALAAEIGDGPVRKLPADEVRSMRREAQQLRGDLESYDLEENTNSPKRVLYHDF